MNNGYRSTVCSLTNVRVHYISWNTLSLKYTKHLVRRFSQLLGIQILTLVIKNYSRLRLHCKFHLETFNSAISLLTKIINNLKFIYYSFWFPTTFRAVRFVTRNNEYIEMKKKTVDNPIVNNAQNLSKVSWFWIILTDQISR